MRYGLLIALPFIAGFAFSSEADSPWLTDWEAARKVARLSGKPIFAILH